jgi:hypothetical protein
MQALTATVLLTCVSLARGAAADVGSVTANNMTRVSPVMGQHQTVDKMHSGSLTIGQSEWASKKPHESHGRRALMVFVAVVVVVVPVHEELPTEHVHPHR